MLYTLKIMMNLRVGIWSRVTKISYLEQITDSCHIRKLLAILQKKMSPSQFLKILFAFAKPTFFYSDISFDIWFAIELVLNCHYNYLKILMFIMIQSIISTCTFLKYCQTLPWKRVFLHCLLKFGKNWRKTLSWKGEENVY